MENILITFAFLLRSNNNYRLMTRKLESFEGLKHKMTDIHQQNHELLESIAGELAIYAPIHEQSDGVAICRIENLHYNEQNGKIVHPPVDGVVSRVDVEVTYERAGDSSSGFWLPKMEFDVKRPKNDMSWDEDMPFGAYQGDVVLQDSLQKFLFAEVNDEDHSFKR